LTPDFQRRPGLKVVEISATARWKKMSSLLCRIPGKRAPSIEIFVAILEAACLKKGDFFQLISTQFCEVKRGFVGR
jgi:hypothetical protein